MSLFTPVTFRSITLRNRIVVSPMCQYSSVDGFANDWHLVHLGSRAVGGAGLVFTEASAVTKDGRISPNDLGIYDDAHIEGLKKITTFVKGQGAAVGIQLAHAGRKASTSRPWDGGKPVDSENGGWWPIVGPSAVPFSDGYATPHELSKGEISEIVSAYGSAARRAREAGFDVIELHAAHGYLVHEFLSPLSNKRTDEYGGSLNNRAGLLLEVIGSVRSNWPEELPIFVRISATEWVDNGWSPEDSVELGKLLRSAQIDLIDCSSGGNIASASIPVGPGYQTEFAAKVKREAQIPTGAVGMITSPAQADQIIRTGQADLVFLARELLRDPYWSNRAAKELRQPSILPNQYARA